MPSRSPDVSMHAAETSRTGRRKKRKSRKKSMWEYLDNTKILQGKRRGILSSDFIYYLRASEAKLSFHLFLGRFHYSVNYCVDMFLHIAFLAKITG